MLYLLYKARQHKRHLSSVAVKPPFLKVGLMPDVSNVCVKMIGPSFLDL